MSDFLKWLFGTDEGHFALVYVMLPFVGLAWIVVYIHVGPAQATPVAVALGMIFQAVLQKIKG